MAKAAIRASLAALLLMVPSLARAGAKPDPGDARVDITAVNFDDTLDADLSIQYYSADGSAGPSRSDTLAPLHAREYTAAAAGFSGAFQGVAVVTSERPLGVVGTVRWTGGVTSDGLKWGQYTAVPSSSDSLYFPNVVYDTYNNGAVGIQNTVISVQNTSGDPVTATVAWTNLAGTEDFAYDIAVPGHGSVVMDTSDWDEQMAGNVPDLPGTSFWATWDFWSGGVKVSCAQPVLCGAAHVTWRQWAAAYPAVTRGGTKIYFPSVERREYDIVANGRFGGGSSRWGGLSALAVTNVDADTAATVTLTFVDSLGLIPNVVYQLPLAAGGTVRLNTHTGAKIGASWYLDHDDMKVLDRYPSDPRTREWVGSVIVESDGSPIVGTCNNLYLDFAKADLYEAAVDGAGSLNVVVPDAYRIRDDSFSLLRIENMAESPAVINAAFYDRSGLRLLRFVDFALAGQSVATPNLNRACFQDGSTDCTKPWEETVEGAGLGTDFSGWIFFNSDQPIAVTVENWFTGMQNLGMGAYNGNGL